MAERVIAGWRMVADDDDHCGRGTYHLEVVDEAAGHKATFDMEG